MKKRLILLLMVSITIFAVLSGCNAAKTQTGSGPLKGQQTNSSLLKVPPKSVNGNITSSFKLSSKELLRTSEEGEVALGVTFVNPLGQQKVGYLSFIVSLNTHSVDLASYPLNQYAKLFDNNGNLLAAQSEWETEGDGHHLVGKLHFKIKQDLQNVDGLKLIVENYGGVTKREFSWDKQYLAF